MSCFVRVSAWESVLKRSSNAVWRDRAAYQHDLEQLGIAHFIDAIISSVNVGFRKPHPVIFDAAMVASGSAPDRCVMVGNSESADIQPARALGMRTIRVAIEEPMPAQSQAHALCDSLFDVARVLREWTTGDEAP